MPSFMGQPNPSAPSPAQMKIFSAKRKIQEIQPSESSTVGSRISGAPPPGFTSIYQQLSSMRSNEGEVVERISAREAFEANFNSSNNSNSDGPMPFSFPFFDDTPAVFTEEPSTKEIPAMMKFPTPTAGEVGEVEEMQILYDLLM